MDRLEWIPEDQEVRKIRQAEGMPPGSDWSAEPESSSLFVVSVPVRLKGSAHPITGYRELSQELRERVAALEEQLIRERQERIALDERVRRLERSDTAAPLEKDPAQKWMEDHRDEVLQHRGESIAVHPVYGIIASGNDYRAMLASIRERGLEGEVVITFVAATGG